MINASVAAAAKNKKRSSRKLTLTPDAKKVINGRAFDAFSLSHVRSNAAQAEREQADEYGANRALASIFDGQISVTGVTDPSEQAVGAVVATL